MPKKSLSFALVCFVCFSIAVFAQRPDMLVDPSSVLANAHSIHFNPSPHDLTNGQAHSRFGIFGIDSVPNFNGQFFANGFDPNGKPNSHWYTNTLGNPPSIGGTTSINAPIQPVNVELDDPDGNLASFFGSPLISSATPLVPLVLNSPVFSNATYTSSDVPTQFSDAVQRAQYFNRMRPDWHTLLKPRVLQPLTLHIRQAPGCPSGPNFEGCNFVFAPNPDGTCCSIILVNAQAFFSALQDLATYDIVNGTITTKDISSFVLPDTFVYFGDISNCCVLGLHTYIFDPISDPEKRWVVNFSSWVSQGSPLVQSFQDVDITALSHEIAETYNDPFTFSDSVHNVTPWWLAPNGNCQTVLETGDVIERLPNAQFPIVLNGYTYHPQNEALLQWFQFKSASDALNGAYSYPDTNVLTQAPAPQKPFCIP